MRNILLGLLVVGVLTLVGIEVKKARDEEKQKAEEAAYLKHLNDADSKKNEALNNIMNMKVELK
ncbi:MAG: hypothetical protein V4507_10805 [Verrucomicrobiota bacterium]